MADKDVNSYRDVPGWFNVLDKLLFDTVLASQVSLTGSGTLIEMGAYLGRSAVVVGAHRQSGERFVVVDLFGSDAELGDTVEDAANRRENTKSYATLNRQQFEANYLALHPELPEVVQGLSSVVVEHVGPGTARFAHIDASHMYDKVAQDIDNAKTLLVSDGVVVLDDFRAQHTPGVAAAAWEAVSKGLRPFAVTDRKLYATWGDPGPYREVIRAAIDVDPLWSYEEQPIHGSAVIRLFESSESKARKAERQAAAEKTAAAQAEAETKKLVAQARSRASAKAEQRVRNDIARQRRRAAERRAARPLWRRAAGDLLPPAVTRLVRRRRARRSA